MQKNKPANVLPTNTHTHTVTQDITKAMKLLGLQGQNNRIVTITSSPQLGVETVCDNHNVTLMCHTDQTTGNIITWYWSNQSQHQANITVMAMMTEVVYTCVVSGNEGKANVTVRANGKGKNVNKFQLEFT